MASGAASATATSTSRSLRPRTYEPRAALPVRYTPRSWFPSPRSMTPANFWRYCAGSLRMVYRGGRQLPKGSRRVAAVSFEGVSKVYPDGTRAVNHVDLEIDDGEFVVLVGPSGCGKTTALRMVAGLEEISEGVLK